MIFKKKLIFCILILLFLPLTYAATNYGEGGYGGGFYGTGGATESPTSEPSSGGGCTYDWQCTGWFPSVCPESEIQERVCVNKGTCSGTKGIPNQTRTCEYQGFTEPLFDIYLMLPDESREVYPGDNIKANVELENFAKVERLDAFMEYWIVDENNKLVAELKDTRAVEKQINFSIEMKIPESTPKGTYKLYAKIKYDGNKTAVAGESFEVLSKDPRETDKEDEMVFLKNFEWIFLIYGIAGIVIILLTLFLIKKLGNKKRRKKTYKKFKSRIKKFFAKAKLKNIGMVAGLILIFLFIGKANITGFFVNNPFIENINTYNLGFILIPLFLGLLIFIHKKRVIKIFKTKKEKCPKDSLKGLIKKEAYTEKGNFLGKIEGVLLGKNKIESLKIKLDKKQEYKLKGILVKYKNIISIGDIVIVNDGVLELIKSLEY